MKTTLLYSHTPTKFNLPNATIQLHSSNDTLINTQVNKKQRNKQNNVLSIRERCETSGKPIKELR
jgi:hypothetical protein